VSPAIDALAARGVVYERAVAASSRTAPSHASILTSRFARDHAIGSVNGATRIRDEDTLASVLRASGYQTAAFVSNSVLERRTGLDKGFAVYDDELPEAEANRRLVFERRADATTARALAWLGGARDPWLLWVHYNDPHGPYDPPPPHDDDPSLSGVARGMARNAPENPLPVLGDQSGKAGIPAYQVLPELRLPREYRARYAREIRFLDGWLGRLLESAEAAASDAGLVVLLTADHGESQGEEGVYFTHGDGTAPDLAHVPFILMAPELAPGRSRDLVHHVDVLPTLLDLVGVPAPAGSAGVPLARHWRERAPVPDRVVFTDVGEQVAAYRDEVFERLRIDPYRESSEVYRWTPGAGWEAAAADPRLHGEVTRYAARTPPLVTARQPDAEERERLRALGYLEPETDADAAIAIAARGIAAEQRGDHAEAIARYREALSLDPAALETANNLAWLLATTDHPGLRDPKAAVELAEKALARDAGNPAVLDTLAAAYAAADRLPEAVRTQRLAVDALRTSDPAIEASFRERLRAYEARAGSPASAAPRRSD
jgi:arylsulfatase A-like enzyme